VTTYTLFGQAGPGSVTSGTGNNGTNGLHFTVSQACTLQGVWHYSPGTSTQLPTSIGLYTVTSLGTSGTLVTSNTASWSGAAGSGWVFASFTSPPALSPGTNYMATQFRNDAASEWFVFYTVTWPVASGILTAPKDESTSALSQGWYNVGTSMAFPTTQSGTAGSNFGMDVQVATGGAQDLPAIQPGPTWFDTFKPGLRKPRPYQVIPAALEQGPLSVTLPLPAASLAGTDVNPASLPSIQPGPAWLDTFKPGLRRPRPQAVPLGLGLTGEFGPFAVALPLPSASLAGQAVLPLDMPQFKPGPAWLGMFKPGWPRPRPPVPPSPPTRLLRGALSLPLPAPLLPLAGTRLRAPENLGAILTLPSPDGATVEVIESATCTLQDNSATLVLPSPDATLVGWTMLNAPLTLSEFNDVTIDIAVTQNGSPYNLTGVTVNLLFKSQAGTPDGSALVFSSGGVSPAITITNAAGGLAVAVIPNTDLDAEVYSFYRLDVVNAGLTNTCLYGAVNWISL
jgi:hypothetical protein